MTRRGRWRLAALFALLLAALSVLVPNLMQMRPISPEGLAVEYMEAYADAQAAYLDGLRQGDDPQLDPRLAKLSRLCALGLLVPPFKAWREEGRLKESYVFVDMRGPDGRPVGLCALPKLYDSTGRTIFTVGTSGKVHWKDAAMAHPGLRAGDTVPPLTAWPDVEEEGWLEVR